MTSSKTIRSLATRGVHLLGILGALALIAGLGCDRSRSDDAPTTSASASDQDDRAEPLDWVLVYYMAYDNDLAWAANPIIDRLRAGLAHDVDERIAVVVVADGFGTDGMSRSVLTATTTTTETLDTEASADVETLGAQLEWVAENLPAQRYALVLLNHGGRLDEVGYDAHPEDGGPSWVNLPAMARRLTAWRESLSGSIELLFLQQCGRGSIENLYELRHVARYLMASETALGAPNDYYEGALRTLAEQPEADGLTLGQAVLSFEPDVQFGSYTIVDASALAELPARFETAFEPLLTRGASLRGAGWDLLRHWVRLERGGSEVVPFEVAAAGRYLVSTLAASPVVVEIIDADGRQVPVSHQIGALGSVDRMLELVPGRYRVRLRATDLSAPGPILVRLVPGPALATLFEPVADEPFVDLVAWLESLGTSNGIGPANVRPLAEWLREEVVVARRISGRDGVGQTGESGLSMLRPRELYVLDRYRDYTIYRDTELDDLHRLLLGGTGTAVNANRE